MTLLEISVGYHDSAEAIRTRLLELQQAVQEQESLAAQGDPDLLFALRQRILTLLPLLRETQELAALTEHYYDRSYYRNGKYTL